MVLLVRPQLLVRARDNVLNQGAEFYAPHAMLRSGKTRTLAPKPLFPGYAFARHPEGRWKFLSGTYGVTKVLGTEHLPAWIPDAELAKLRAREGKDGFIRLESREFEVGEKVRVSRGVVSLDAIVDGMSGRDRVFVLMEFLGALQRAEVAVGDLTRE